MSGFRIYIRVGCQFCEQAVQWFQARQNIPTEYIVAGNDPIINAGIKAKGDNEVPLVVSFTTQKIIKGFRPEEYQKHVDAFLASNSPESFTVVESESVNPEPPAPVDGPENPSPRVQ
jgi:hypothetical protein